MTGDYVGKGTRRRGKYLFQIAKPHFPSIETSTKELTQSKPVFSFSAFCFRFFFFKDVCLTFLLLRPTTKEDKKAPLNVLALHASYPVGPIDQLVPSLLKSSELKNLKKNEKFYAFFVKELLSSCIHREDIISTLSQTLATSRDAKDLQSNLPLVSKYLSGSATGWSEEKQQVGKLLLQHLANTLKDLKSQKKASKIKKRRILLRLILSTLRLVCCHQESHTIFEELSANAIFECLNDEDMAIADHAVAICQAISSRSELQEVLHQHLEKAKTNPRSLQSKANSADSVSFRTDLCRLLGHCLQTHYMQNDVPDDLPELTSCRKSLLSTIESDEEIQVFLEAIKQLSCDVHVSGLDLQNSSKEEMEVARKACQRCWGFLSAPEQQHALDAIIQKLNSLLSSSERDLQNATICAAISSLFKCAILANEAASAATLATLRLIPTLKGLMERSSSLNVFFIFATCILWGSGLSTSLCFTRGDIESRLQNVFIPEFLMLDFIAEVSSYIKVAKDTQMEELLLLLSMLVRKAANPKAMQYLDEAWKESMQRTAGVKAIVVANALNIISSGGGDGASVEVNKTMKAKSVELLAEYLNFAFEEYQWKRKSTQDNVVDGQAVSKSLRRGHANAAQREPLMFHALKILEEALLFENGTLERKLISAIQTIAIRSGEPYQGRCYSILKNASEVSTSATRQVFNQAIAVLDDMKFMQDLFCSKVKEFGTQPENWPEKELEIVRKLHSDMLDILLSICFIPKHLYLPLGKESQGFVRLSSN